jgi:DeoR family transcriptional regulator, fructose operon transcriptional repressor
VFVADRKEKIGQLLLEYGKVKVNRLSEILNVSEVTIRKDLERLEAEGFLIRTHGGAVLREDLPGEERMTESDILNIDSKKMIGIFSSALVQDRDVVFLGPGSTCLQIAKNLHDKKDIIVITTNLSVMAELAGEANCRVIALGGELDASEYGIMMTGEMVLENIKNMYFNKIFLSVDGITFQRGYMIRNAFMAQLYRTLKNYSDELIIVADNTKFDVNSLSNVGPLDFADKVISDQLAPHEYIKYYFEHDIQIFTTYPLK